MTPTTSTTTPSLREPMRPELTKTMCGGLHSQTLIKITKSTTANLLALHCKKTAIIHVTAAVVPWENVTGDLGTIGQEN